MYLRQIKGFFWKNRRMSTSSKVGLIFIESWRFYLLSESRIEQNLPVSSFMCSFLTVAWLLWIFSDFSKEKGMSFKSFCTFKITLQWGSLKTINLPFYKAKQGYFERSNHTPKVLLHSWLEDQINIVKDFQKRHFISLQLKGLRICLSACCINLRSEQNPLIFWVWG